MFAHRQLQYHLNSQRSYHRVALCLDRQVSASLLRQLKVHRRLGSKVTMCQSTASHLGILNTQSLRINSKTFSRRLRNTQRVFLHLINITNLWAGTLQMDSLERMPRGSLKLIRYRDLRNCYQLPIRINQRRSIRSTMESLTDKSNATSYLKSNT